MILACSTSLPGGNQVDGLPPVANRLYMYLYFGKRKLQTTNRNKRTNHTNSKKSEASMSDTAYESSRIIQEHVQPAVNRQPGYRREDS